MRTMQSTSELRRQREQRLKELAYFRDWIHSHPQHVDPAVRPAAIDFLNSSIAELERELVPEMTNIRRAGRMPLRDRLRNLITIIVAQSGQAVKGRS